MFSRPLPPEDKLWLKPYVDLQAYEDPAQGALDFAQELDPAWLIVDTVIGEGKLCCDPHLVSSVGGTWPLPGSFLRALSSHVSPCLIYPVSLNFYALEQPLPPTHFALWFWGF